MSFDNASQGRTIVPTPGGLQEMTVINESGLWSLVLTSRKPAAKRFKKWITSEVIPSIRKTGGYMVATPDETPEEQALRAMAILQATAEHQRAQLSIVQPKTEAHNRIAGVDGSLNFTEAAKSLQVRPKDQFDRLSHNGWIYKRPSATNRGDRSSLQ